MQQQPDNRIQYAVQNTEIIRTPRQHLSTFGVTNIYYYLVTEPAYAEFTSGPAETVVREGRVVAQRPQIVTPYYLSHLEGFSSDARRYFEALVREFGPNSPGIFYAYKNEPKELNIVANSLAAVVENISRDIEQRADPLAAIIKGVDEMWDVSILKFIFEMTLKSVTGNLHQMKTRGLLDVDASGIPAEIRLRIDELFRQVARGEREPKELKDELDRWGVFSHYEDRFFALFGGR